MSNFHSPKREFPTSCLTNTTISKTVWSTTEMSKNCFDQHSSFAFLGFDELSFVRPSNFIGGNSNRNGFVEFHFSKWVLSMVRRTRRIRRVRPSNLWAEKRKKNWFVKFIRGTDNSEVRRTAFVVFSVLSNISRTVRRSAKRLKFSPPLANSLDLRAGSLKWVTLRLLDDAPIT